MWRALWDGMNTTQIKVGSKVTDALKGEGTVTFFDGWRVAVKWADDDADIVPVGYAAKWWVIQ